MIIDEKSIRQIEQIVRGVPGVRSVYPQPPYVLAVARPVIDRLRGAFAVEDAPTVSIRIGIDDADSSRAVCERVYLAVRQFLDEAQEPEHQPKIAVSVVAIG